MNNRDAMRRVVVASTMATFALAQALTGLFLAMATKKSRRPRGGAQ